MFDNNKLFETILCINDEEQGEIISIKLQFINKPGLTANGNIDYKTLLIIILARYIFNITIKKIQTLL